MEPDFSKLLLPPDIQAQLLFAQASAHHQKDELDLARGLYDKVLAVLPANGETLRLRGLVDLQAGDSAGALAFFQRFAEVDAGNADAHFHVGLAHQQAQRCEAAVDALDRAIALMPDFAAAHNNRGLALRTPDRLDEALAALDRAVGLKPGFHEAHNNRGLVLFDLHRHAAALRAFEKAIALSPGYAAAYNNRGNVWHIMGRSQDALVDYDRALALAPDHAEAHHNRAVAFADMNQHEAAIAGYDTALKCNPNYAFVSGARLFQKLLICDWHNLDAELAAAVAGIRRGEAVIEPLAGLSLLSSLADQRKAAEIWTAARNPARAAAMPAYAPRKKLRIGYFSPDFRNHPVATLTAGLFEAHDRDAFEVIGFSFGRPSDDAMRRRLTAAFDQFHDIAAMSDAEVVARARALEIDIAVDLTGYTQDCRPNIFARRAAPIQISYLGFPGTMGAPFIDYMVADHTVVPRAPAMCMRKRSSRCRTIRRTTGRVRYPTRHSRAAIGVCLPKASSFAVSITTASSPRRFSTGGCVF